MFTLWFSMSKLAWLPTWQTLHVAYLVTCDHQQLLTLCYSVWTGHRVKYRIPMSVLSVRMDQFQLWCRVCHVRTESRINWRENPLWYVQLFCSYTLKRPISGLFPQLKFVANWQLTEDIFKNKKKPMCWELNPRPMVYKARTLPIDQIGKQDWRVLKFVLNKACPIVCNLVTVVNSDNSEKVEYTSTLWILPWYSMEQWQCWTSRLRI